MFAERGRKKREEKEKHRRSFFLSFFDPNLDTFLQQPKPKPKQGFLKSWGMILVSEIGDKTFFIAAIMAMKQPQRLVFAGAMGALAAMTVLSAFLGWAAPNLISKKWTHWAAVALFFAFGLRSLWEGLTGESGVSSYLR